jgi:hypothetical protein
VAHLVVVQWLGELPAVPLVVARAVLKVPQGAVLLLLVVHQEAELLQEEECHLQVINPEFHNMMRFHVL